MKWIFLLIIFNIFASPIDDCIILLSKIRRDAHWKQGLPYKYIDKQFKEPMSIYGQVFNTITNGMNDEDKEACLKAF